MNKKLLALLLAVVLVFGILPMGVMADTPGNWSTDADTAWYGDGSSPTFTIANAEQLAGLAKLVNEGNTFANKTITLENNIDLSGKGWHGIGVYAKSTEGKPFSGIFDGNNKKISGMTFSNGAENEYRGLFNQLLRATVKDLTVEVNGFAPNVTGSYGGAAIAGHAIGSTIDNCVAEGTITGTHNVAGIVVRIAGSTIKNCTNKAALTNNYSKLGGIVNLSQNEGVDPDAKSSSIENCVNEGSITSTDRGEDGVGGIIGWIGYGKVGSQYPAYYVAIKGCENKGDITASGTEAKVGQIVGVGATYMQISDGNKGVANNFAIGNETDYAGLQFATVEGNVATYTGSLESGKTYLVTAKDANPNISLGDTITSITFDQSIASISSGWVPTDSDKFDLEIVTDGDLVTYSVTKYVAEFSGTKYTLMQAAIDDAVDGDTITLLADATETVTVDGKTLTFEADPTITTGANITLNVANGGSVIKDAASLTALQAPAGYGWKNDTILTKTWNVTFVEDGKADVVKPVFDRETVTGIPTITRKTGYTAQWHYNNGTADVAFTDAVVITADTEVTAVFTPIEYTIKFDANGGQGTMADMTGVKYDEIAALTSNTFTNANKNFAGWARGFDGAVEYADGAKVKSLTEINGATFTLYAVWTDKAVLNPTFNVQTHTYDGQKKEYVLQNMPVEGFTVIDYSNLNPTNAGSYDVIIRRAEDETYAAYQTTVVGGLVIEKATITITYAGETIKEGETPALNINDTGLIGNSTFSEFASIDRATVPTTVGSHALMPQGAVISDGDNYNIVYQAGYLVITAAQSYNPPIQYRNDNFETATGAFNDMAYYGREAREGDIVTLKVALSELGKKFGLDLSKIEVKYEVEGAAQITGNYLYTGDPIYVDGIATDFKLAKGVNVIVAHIYYNGYEAGKCAPFYVNVQ